MYILGYSGFDQAIAFREKNLPGLTEQEYRICQGMDAAAVLLQDGKIIAAASEERFTYLVHTGQFPQHAIEYCLREAGIHLDQVDAICHGFNYEEFKDLFLLEPFTEKNYYEVYDPAIQKKLFQEKFNVNVSSKFLSIHHHHAHAASAYFMSPFDDALVFVADGLGETDSISIYHGQGNSLQPLYHYDLSSSLGILYLIMTIHLGFEPNNDEYKVMGLAPYGDPDRFKFFFENCVDFDDEGQINIPMLGKNKTTLAKQTYRDTRDWLSQVLIPERKPGEPIKQIHKDIAAGLQYILSSATQHVLTYWQKRVGSKNLCMAGGVALNCTNNGMLLQNGLFDHIYVQPAAGDDGSALGAALYKHHAIDGHTTRKAGKNPLPFYGSEFTEQEILTVLEQHAEFIEFIHLNEDELVDRAARYLNEGKIIGWMQGRMEFGPRALGNRSILANPLLPDMQNRVNQTIKRREEFRPFAPSAIAEEAHVYFDISSEIRLPYMLFTVQVREAYRAKLPAITHIDGSARLQTVEKEQNEKYWKLLNAFKKQSGYPILLNTSFNVKGQPIVRTPQDAVTTYLSTQLDLLFIGNFMVVKKDGKL